MKEKIEIEVVGKVMGFSGGKCSSCQRLTDLSDVGMVCNAPLYNLSICEGVIQAESKNDARARLVLEAEMHGNDGPARIHLSLRHPGVVHESEETRRLRERVL